MRLNCIHRITLLSLMTLLVSCNVNAPGSVTQLPTPTPAVTPIPLSEVAMTVSHASNNLGFGLLQVLRASTPDENIFLSPISLSLLLQIAYNGADGQSAQEIAQVLQVDGMDIEVMNKASKEFQEKLTTASDIEILIGNSIWIRQDFTLLDAFLERTQEYFNAKAAQLDFGSQEALERINTWASEGTKGKIDHLLDELDPNIVAYLINTVYFKGDWSEPFSRESTQPMPFHLLDGSELTVPMMSRSGRYSVTTQGGYKALALPYVGGRMRMIIVLPDADVALSSVMDEMTPAVWQELLAQLEAHQDYLQLSLPRFKLEYDKEMNDALMAMGMQSPFESADFANMIEDGGLWISYIRHKAIVEVNEEGTVAVAASIAEIPASEPPSFIVDRPFFFAIHDMHTDTILFIGTVYQPEPLEG